jgi:hypothetical protein
LVGIQEVNDRENERFRNVLNRNKKLQSSNEPRGQKRSGKFHGVIDGDNASRNKFQRNVKYSKRQGKK